MHIVYAVTGCSEQTYEQLFARVKKRPAVPAQKYHRLLIEGLSAHEKVDVVANPPVNRSIIEKSWIKLSKEEIGNICYHNLPAIRNPLLKLIVVSLGTFFKTFSLKKKDTVVVVDCLNRTVALCAQLAARICGRRCVGIVTDLPELLQGSRFSVSVANYIIEHCTDYVFLTEEMNRRLNKNGKPYVILEGHADIGMRECGVSLKDKSNPRICLYAGAIKKKYGINTLVEGFTKAGLDNVVLHLYGYCDYENEMAQIVKDNPNILYGGLLLNEQEATLLVNPRPTHEEYVKYSFPSKTMEYMASGTPVLTTVLPGMPKDYYPYVYLLEDETADGIAKALKEIFAHTDEELFEKGKAAKEFILSTRNNVVQAGKILEMLEKTSDRK